MDQRYNEKVLINKGGERKNKCMRQQRKTARCKNRDEGSD